LIATMPRPRNPHLHRERNRHGIHVWYVRKDRGRRIRLRSEFGSEAFKAEYEAAITGKSAPRGEAVGGTMQWLWDAYRKTGAWTHLAPATRRQRENIMLNVLKTGSAIAFGAITEGDIVAGLDRRAETPSAARNFLDTMRGLFKWAKGRGHVRKDPTAGVDPPKRRRSAGFAPWTQEDVTAYQAKWPLGTPQRVWLDVMLYTGLRRGDAARVGPGHVKNGVVEIATEKSGERVLVALPILDVLQATLDAGPIGADTWIVGARGKRFTKESFGNLFSEAAQAAGIFKSAHGVRKIAATIAAENGATEAELDAIFGWTGGRMASHYTKTANRTKLARQAAEKLKSIPAPGFKVRGASDKVISNQPPTEMVVGEAEVQSTNDSNNMRKGEGE
jgi:integrase